METNAYQITSTSQNEPPDLLADGGQEWCDAVDDALIAAADAWIAAHPDEGYTHAVITREGASSSAGMGGLHDLLQTVYERCCGLSAEDIAAMAARAVADATEQEAREAADEAERAT